MKKLLALLVPFILFSCYDAELVIPGENVGNPGVEIDPITEYPILESYISDYPEFRYNLDFDESSLTNFNGIEITRNEEGKISSIMLDGKNYTFTYDANSKKYKSIEDRTSKTILKITYNDKGYVSSAKKIVAKNTIADYVITTTDRGFIDSYKYTLNSSGSTPTKSSVLNINIKELNGGVDRIVNAINYQQNNQVITNMSFQYDESLNPIVKLSSTDFNPLVLLYAFNEGNSTNLQLDALALLISKNNRTNVDKDGENFILEYALDKDNYPQKADVKKSEDGETIGEVVYNYR